MGFKSVLATKLPYMCNKDTRGLPCFVKAFVERPQREGEIPSLEDGGKFTPPAPSRALDMVSAAARPEPGEGDGAGDAAAGDPSVP